MNVLDENIIAEQRQLLRRWRIRVRQVGVNVGRKGFADDDIIGQGTPVRGRRDEMTFAPSGFDNVEVLEVGVSGPNDANRLFIVTGVALIYFDGTSDDWRRDDVSFIVPG